MGVKPWHDDLPEDFPAYDPEPLDDDPWDRHTTSLPEEPQETPSCDDDA